MSVTMYRWWWLNTEAQIRDLSMPARFEPEATIEMPMFDPYETEYTLRSLSMGCSWRGPAFRSPTAPSKSNVLGIYGFKTPERCFELIVNLFYPPRSYLIAAAGKHRGRMKGDLVYGECAGHGHVVEQEDGYRVEVATIRNLILVDEPDRCSDWQHFSTHHEEVLAKLGDKYQCPVRYGKLGYDPERNRSFLGVYGEEKPIANITTYVSNMTAVHHLPNSQDPAGAGP